MDPWKMPSWMKPYEPYFSDRGAFSVEASMNMYGAKAACKLADADPDLRAILINTQVGLLTALMGAGLLLPPNANKDEANAELLSACKLALAAFEGNQAIDWSILEKAIDQAEQGVRP